MYIVQIPKSACGTAMFTTEVTNKTTYYMECQFSMTRQNSMKSIISFSKNITINMHVHVVCCEYHLSDDQSSCYCSGNNEVRVIKARDEAPL